MSTGKVYIGQNAYKSLPMFLPRLISKVELPEFSHTVTVVRVPNGYIYINTIRKINDGKPVEYITSTFVPPLITGDNNENNKSSN